VLLYHGFVNKILKSFDIYATCLVFLMLGQSCSEDKPKPIPDRPIKKSERVLGPLAQKTYLAGLKVNLQGLRTLRAQFHQTRISSMLTRPVEGRGQFIFKSPGYIRFELYTPFPGVTILTPEEGAHFEKVKSKWRKRVLHAEDAAGSVFAHLADLVQGRFDQLEKQFYIKVVQGDSFLLLLTPKRESLQKRIGWLEIVVNSGQNAFLSINLVTDDKNHTLLKFSEEIRNPSLADGTFDLSGPAPQFPE